MIIKLIKEFICIILLLFTCMSFSQTGVVSGVLQDELGPVSDITIKVKGAENGTVTDFDGNYAIKCSVGDTLIFAHVSYGEKEVIVTKKMFGNKKAKRKKIKKVAKTKQVHNIYNDAYSDLINKRIDSSKKKNRDFFSKGITYIKKKKKNDRFNNIKKIVENDSTVLLNFYDEKVYYQISYNSLIGNQFVSKKTIPNLQNTYVQGRPFNGVNQWFGAGTNEVFSFGPNKNTLQFNNENYLYDINGLLVPNNNFSKILPYKNELFKSSTLHSNGLKFSVQRGESNLSFDVYNKVKKDIFNDKKYKLNQVNVDFKLNHNHKVFFKHNKSKDKQPNTNGLLNNTLLSNYVTPISFQNSQGFLFNNNLQQRSFSNQVNNPLWLLNMNENQNVNTNSIYGLRSEFDINGDIDLYARANYSKSNTTINFALPNNTIGFENGYLSEKMFNENQLNASLLLDVNFDFGYNSLIYRVDLNNSINYKKNELDYSFTEKTGFTNLDFINPLNENVLNNKLKNDVIHFSNEVKLDIKRWSILTLKNNGITSSLQGSKLFLPSVQYYLEIAELLNSDWMRNSVLIFGFAKDANSLPLYYQNKSHNSLTILPSQSQSFLANNDLFNSEKLKFETATQFEVEANLFIARRLLEFNFKYYNFTTKNAVFPILNNNEFTLENIANTKSNGIEAKAILRTKGYSDFRLTSSFIFSKNNTKVTSLNNNLNNIAIAGFSTISKNLIVGRQTGTIVGSAYLRNQNGDKIIDDFGYPIVKLENQIIGNTTPNFNLSFDNELKLKNFKLNFLFNYQNGGDVWLGTKNVLNYFGRSQESANLRNTTNFIFNGVNQQGNTNTIAVDFANPNNDVSTNRWVRYGYSGIAEDAIVDGTYLNLKTISLSYGVERKHLRKIFFNEMNISLYANNLLTFTKSDGIIPNSSLFDFSNGSGLNYFNLPLVKEIGFKVNFKI